MTTLRADMHKPKIETGTLLKGKKKIGDGYFCVFRYRRNQAFGQGETQLKATFNAISKARALFYSRELLSVA